MVAEASGGSAESRRGTGRRGPGRPPKGAEASTRDRILVAAEQEFADSGYAGASLRGIARRAEVDPSLVHHYFDGKVQLFVESLHFPANPGAILAAALDGPPEGLGERAVRVVVTAWDDPKVAKRGLVLLRTASGSTPASAMIRAFIAAEITGRLAQALDSPDAELRATLAASQIVGLIYVRYGLAFSPLADLGIDEVVAVIAPTVQRYLLGDLGAGGALT